jgi:hypothetical protein
MHGFAHEDSSEDASPRAGVDDVLAVIDHQQQVAIGEVAA